MTTRTTAPALSLALVLSTAAAALGGLLFGFDTAVIAGTTRALTQVFDLSATRLGVTVSCALWGTVAACLVAPVPARRLGARESLRLVGLLYVVSAAGCAWSGSWPVFLFFRFVGGVAIGGCSIFAPMYIAETSPAAIRGRLVSCFQLSIVTGILVAYASNYAIGRQHLGATEWRWEIGVAALPSLLFSAALALIPRSPRWLVRQGRLEEARESLERMGFAGAADEVETIRASVAREGAATQAPALWPAYRRPLLLALALGVFNQMSGINAILYYLNDIFAQAGFTSVSASEQAVAIGLANLLFTLVGMALIDRVGRRPLLLVGALGMAAALAGVAAVFGSGRHRELLLPLLVAFIAFFASSQGAVVWVYLSEIFPNAVRDRGQSLASFSLWLLTAVVAGTFPSIAAWSSSAAFAVFSVAMVVQFVCVLRFFPETRGRSLEAIGTAVSE